MLARSVVPRLSRKIHEFNPGGTPATERRSYNGELYSGFVVPLLSRRKCLAAGGSELPCPGMEREENMRHRPPRLTRLFSNLRPFYFVTFNTHPAGTSWRVR